MTTSPSFLPRERETPNRACLLGLNTGRVAELPKTLHPADCLARCEY